MADSSSLASEVAKHSVAPIGRELGFLFNYHSNIDGLRSQLEKLGDVKGEVDRSVDIATRNGDEIDLDVKNWLVSANTIIEEAKKFLDDEKNAEKSCFNGLCPNLKSRYQLSKKAKKTAVEITKIQDGGKFDVVTYDAPSQGIGSTSGFEAFESRMSTFKGIMDALTRPDIEMIGVCGVSGVGKTMLVKEVAKKAKEDRLFDAVVMILVSQNPKIRKIQGQIADQLGLKLDEQMETDRATQLRRKLQNKSSILVILDDIWEKLDLAKVGIPFGGEELKIVVTYGNQDTLRNDMDAEMNFSIGVLPEQEAWELFMKMAGDSIKAAELKPIAIEVAKQCAGLPLTVAAVASALKRKSLPVWKEALQQLRSSTLTNINGMNAKVFSPLYLSYSYLESEEAKSLFLLCSLLPKDYQISIQDFLKYGKGLGLFQDTNTVEESRNKVRKLVHNLKASCLLLDSDIIGSTQMHEVVRDVGISIASKDKHISIVRNSVELEEIKKNCHAISLPYSDIHELPTTLECPDLEFFSLFSNDPSMTILETFFEGMKQLKVLNLTNICFSSMPSSLYFLSNLQTLCLDQCVLQDIPIHNLAKIGELKKLEILSFESSNIEELPREIGQLALLRLLDLRNCSKLKVIPSNLLASLSQLEDLYMGNSFVNWGVNGNASFDELKHLSHLVTLEIGITNAKILPNNFSFEKLMRYRIFVGDVWDWSSDYETSRILKLKLNTSIQQEIGVNMLLKRTDDLYLYKLKGIRIFLNDLDREGFSHLKHLHVESSSEIEYVINTVEWVPQRAFPNLKSLFLLNLIDLKEICSGQLPAESFGKLRMVKVEGCDTLKNLFSLSMARSLAQLQEIQVTNCNVMYEIVVEGKEAEDNNEAKDKSMFTQLRYLTLQYLPKLANFFPKVKTMPSISRFNEKVAFQNLKFLNIENCDNLRNLFSPSMALDLVELRELKIRNCEMMEEIFEKEIGAKEASIDKMVFPLLSYILLEDLPNLTSFNSGIHTLKCPSLKLMRIENCPEIKTLTSAYDRNEGVKETSRQGDLDIPDASLFNKKVAFPILEELVIISISSKEIWIDQLPVGSFWKLKSLQVEDCEHLLNIVPPNLLMRLQNMESLVVKNGDSVKYIFGLGGINDKERHVVAATKLRFMSLEGLPSLVQIWKKDSLRFSSFQKLNSLEINMCHNLRHIFAASIAKSLVRLQELSVTYCESVEEIVEKEGKEEAMDKIVFPQMTSMTLNFLPKIKSFCQGICISEWPSLKKLVVERSFSSESAGIFVTELINFRETYEKGHLDAPIKQSFFVIEKVAFPNLEELLIENVNSLKQIFTTSIAKSLVQLQRLLILYCEMVEEIVEKEGVEEEAMGKIVFPQLTSLTLGGLPQLKSFCHGTNILEWPSLKHLYLYEIDNVEICALELSSFEESVGKGHVGTPTKQPLFLVDKVAFPSLEELTLRSMSSMKEIWQGQFHAASFGKLSVLEVTNCESFTHLLPFAIAKILLQIKSITVNNCKMMKEIIAIEEGEVIDETTFSQLNSLKLRKLPNLISFFPGSNIFSFPSLKEVLVEKCAELKTFSFGILNTPKLEKVHIQSEGDLIDKVLDNGFWKGDLNATIQYLFAQKVEFLRLSQLSELTQIFDHQFPIEACYVYLVVEKCTSLLKVFSSNMLESLWTLEKITVESCDSLEQVFDLEGLNYEKNPDGLYTNLEEMNLTELPKLKCIWNKDPTGILRFQSLRWVNIHKCNSLTNLFYPSMCPDFWDLGLKIIDCLNMEEIVEKEKGAKEEAIGFDLKYLILEGLPNLSSFYPGNHTLWLQKLTRVKIARCPGIKTFSSTHEVLQETYGDGNRASLFINNKVIFPDLEELELEELYNIKEIWQGQFHEQSFCELTTLTVRLCQSFTHLLPFAIAKRLVQIKSITVVGCEMMKEIIASEEGESTDETTTLSQLNSLKLINLPNLTSFYSGSITFSFPSLEQVLVEECPKLKTFSDGILYTPKLEKVNVQENKWVWKGDLNTTIQHLFAQKVELGFMPMYAKCITKLQEGSELLGLM